MIPKNIKKNHLLSAINEIEANPELRKGRYSSTYDLVYNDISYPPKLVISLANKYANGVELRANEFQGGKDTQAFEILVKNDFDIQLKKEKISPTYWLFSPGRNADKWLEFQKKGIMALGWGIGDLSSYSSKKEMLIALKENRDDNTNPTNDAKANWEFLTSINKGDIIIAKKGTNAYLGYGVVISDYFYDKDGEKEGFESVRKVNWIKSGLWEEDDIVLKTLTNISKYTDYVSRLIQLIGIEINEGSISKVDFTNVMTYEIKSSAAQNSNELFHNNGKYFYWNQDKFKNLIINDVVFVVNPTMKNASYMRINKKSIKVKNKNDKTYFSDEGQDFIVSGKWEEFVRLEILDHKNSSPFSWKSLGSSEITYFYGDRVSSSTLQNNLERISQLKLLFDEDSEAFRILEVCAIGGHNSFFELTYKFLNQVKTSNLKYKEYSVNFKNTVTRASFGKGTSAKVPWISFLAYDQTTTKGIYPVLLYYKDQELLILAYGVSETNQPSRNWTLENKVSIVNFFDQKYNVKPYRYGSSYVHTYFDLKTKDFIKYKEKFNNSLENIIQHFHSEFTNSVKLNKQTMKQQSINRILFGPPGTGKTYSTINHALSIIENKELVDLKNEKRERLRERFENYVDEGLIKFTTFHQSYSYEDFVEGIRPQVKEVSSGVNGQLKKEVSYDVLPGVFKTLVEEAIKEENESKKYVLIIDEINRGNISDIFGELITLLEFTKRAKGEEEVTLELPYSKESFKVPSNLYTIGTMNTADRSISLIDTALRRRFDFIELPPSLSVIENNVGNKGVVDGVNLVKLLETINNRIEFLLDKDHLIGHSYFLSINNIEDLKEVFKNNILPLLEEYFHNDYFNIQRVLGDNPEWEKNKELKIISTNDEIDNAIFGGQIDGYEENQIFKVREDFSTKELFIAIYKK